MAQHHLYSNDPWLALSARMDSMQREIDMLRNAIAPRTKQYEFKVVGDADPLTVGDAKFYFLVPHDVNRAVLVAAHMYVINTSSSGKPTVQLHNMVTGLDMLLTKITIDVSERSSYTASVPPVIDEANNEVHRDDLIRIDVDVAGTGTLGLGGILTFA